MKKLLAVLVALSMLLLFAGCGGGNPDNTTTTAEITTAAATTGTGNTQNSEQPPKGYLEIFTSGTYYMNARDSDGVITETYAKGGMKASLTQANGVASRTVLRDGKMYIITDRQGIVLVTDKLSSAPADVGAEVAAAAPSYLGDGIADFAGKSLPYQEYGSANDKVQCFLADGTLVGVRSINKSKTTDTAILMLNQGVPDSRFEIPVAYAQIIV